jgi:WD40 repeat protein
MNILLSLLLVTISAQLENSDIQLVQLWDIRTPENLLAEIASGYPKAWLAEILADTTLPEIDRNWLDCRMRVVIARDLHLFFDRDGNRVYIEADFIKSGDSYWRENLIVNPPGEPFRYECPELPSGLTSEPGIILNVYGEQIGSIATASYDLIHLSRDASVGVCRSGGGHIALDFACFLYPDGSFREIDIDDVSVQYTLSEDGNTAVFHSRQSYEPGSPEHMLYVFDREGDLIFERLMPSGSNSGGARPSVSPDSKYIATGLYCGEIWLLDAITGETVHTWGGSENRLTGSTFIFSPDSRYLCASGPCAVVFDCLTGETIWQQEAFDEGTLGSRPLAHNTFDYLSTSSDLSVFVLVRRKVEQTGLRYSITSHITELYTRDGEKLLHISSGGIPYLSPSGCILLIENSDGLVGGATSTPLVLARILSDSM